MNKSMFILGASGFVGREVVRTALADGWSVKALARSQSTRDQLAAMGAIVYSGDADNPEAWIAEARNTRVIVDLIQPELPSRVTLTAMQKVAAKRLEISRRLTTAMTRIPAAERPLLLSISGTDDLQPNAHGRIDGASELQRTPAGFAHIGIPVRKWIENSGIDAVFVYLGTVYGPGKSFAATIFPRLAKGSWRVIGKGNNHIPLVHVEDAARALVHLAGLDAQLTRQRTFVLADASAATAREFFDDAAQLLGAKRPGSLPTGLASLVAGRVLVETMTRDLIADPSDLIRTGFEFKYPSYREGLPPTLKTLGYSTAQRPVVPAPKSAFAFWLLLIATVGVLLAENLATFKLSVPYMSDISGGLPLLDMRLGYTPDDAYRLFDALGAAGREAYRQLLWSVDIVIPLLISSFLWSAVSRGALKRWRLLALAGGAFDYLENGAILILLAHYPQELESTAKLAAVFTVVKQFSYGTGLVFAIAGYLLSLRPKNTANDTCTVS